MLWTKIIYYLQYFFKFIRLFIFCLILLFSFIFNSDIIYSNDYIVIDKLYKDENYEYKTMNFGKYYIDNNIKSDIEWYILSENEHMLFLLSKYIIDVKRYNQSYFKICWENSSIRKWLNNDFYNIAFNDYEKNLIYNVSINDSEDYIYETENSNSINDKVFLLSITETLRFCNMKIRTCVGTDYAIKKGLWISKNLNSMGNSVWWLRSPGSDNSYASLVYAGGHISFRGDQVSTNGNGIRPVICVKKKFIDLIK